MGFAVARCTRPAHWIAALVLVFMATSAAAQEKDVPGFWERTFGIKPAKTAETMEELLGREYVVAPRTGGVAILHTPSSIWSGPSTFSTASRDLHRLGEWMQMTNKWADGRIWYTMEGPTKDQYGRQSRDKYFTLVIDTAEMRKIDYQNLFSQQMLNFANVEWIAPFAARAALEYCKDEPYSRAFCLALTRRFAR